MNSEERKTSLLRLEREFKTKQHPPIDKNVSFCGAAKSISIGTISERIEELNGVLKYFENDTLLNGNVVFTVKCKKIMAKSNRISWLFDFGGEKKANTFVVGSSFYGDCFQQITYSMSKIQLKEAIRKLTDVKNVALEYFGETIEKEQLNYVYKNLPKNHEIFVEVKKSYLVDTIQQMSFINQILVDDSRAKATENVVISILPISSIKSKDVLEKLGIKPLPVDLPPDVYLLTKDDANILGDKAPYIIANQTVDFSRFDISSMPDSYIEDSPSISEPKNEPIIGVIDGLYYKNKDKVYFDDWVESYEMLEPGSKKTDILDYSHGTEVDSLLVDLPRLNPELDDGCGNFRVRHFGIANKNGVSVTYMLKTIRQIVEDPKNSDIKVWNLCLGNSVCEINRSYISLEGALLDELQSNNPNIIFVVSGTNKKGSITSEMKIGAPADSINSVVVNSCTFDNKPASYSRCGPALSFFIKPDVSTYGGDFGEELYVWSPWGKWHNCGTSFAAPLISRKLAFLMGVMNLDRTIAKSLLIDSALKWEEGFLSDSKYIGRGIIKPRIENIVKGDGDEIKFFIQGHSKEYMTYTYSLPVPICADNKYHYRARATLCYFPVCSRSQGVDYTNTELSLQFGRLKAGNKGIDTIDKYSDYLDTGFMFEKDARSVFRKWDNLKTVVDSFPSRKIIGKDVINSANKNWGIQVSYLERGSNAKSDIIWGLVVTLKATDGINRINDFIHDCEFNGWLVTPIIYEEYVTVHHLLDEEIELK